MIFLALAATAPETLPVWMMVIGMVLTGGSVAAIFQYLTKRNETKAGSQVAASTANLTDVNALTVSLTSLSQENGRLSLRVDTLDGRIEAIGKKLDERNLKIDELEAELKKRPTKEELLDVNGKLRKQLLDLGETPTNGPAVPPTEAAKE